MVVSSYFLLILASFPLSHFPPDCHSNTSIYRLWYFSSAMSRLRIIQHIRELDTSSSTCISTSQCHHSLSLVYLPPVVISASPCYIYILLLSLASTVSLLPLSFTATSICFYHFLCYLKLTLLSISSTVTLCLPPTVISTYFCYL